MKTNEILTQLSEGLMEMIAKAEDGNYAHWGIIAQTMNALAICKILANIETRIALLQGEQPTEH